MADSSSPAVAPRLRPVRVPSRPRAVALVLHGGGSHEGRTPVSTAQPSVLRMLPVGWALALRGGRGLAVYRQLNTWRGWDEKQSPLDDTAASLAQLRERHGGVPVALVGHSLGGRTSLLAGRSPGVRCIVALNPYVYPQDGAADYGGLRVLVVHGDADRVADLGRARDVAVRLARTAEVGFETVAGGTHAMLRHAGSYDLRAARFVRDWVRSLG